MSDALDRARALGVAVELADLGTWGGTTLVAEYDPDGPIVRINTRALPMTSSCDVREHIERAVRHELYHHDEAIGTVERAASRAEREAHANDVGA